MHRFTSLAEPPVPSLQVRVYRNLQRAEGRRWRSLTTSEGVSSYIHYLEEREEFPHYK